MFAVEIAFQDGISQPEMILIRRPQALIGGSEYAHVVIEDMKSLNFQLRIIRSYGRHFSCRAIPDRDGVDIPIDLDADYNGSASFDLGRVRLQVTALDTDLTVRDGEPPDKSGVRVLRSGLAQSSPSFPAVMVAGAVPMVVSFHPSQPVYIGRSKQCAVRLDSAEISSRHARIGFEQGEFWIEDLGSTNGTFINQQQISGRVNVSPGTPITLGREFTVVGITSEDQIGRASAVRSDSSPRTATAEARYPILISLSEVARPARLVLTPGSSFSIGRDPTSDLWLGAPHVSRKHSLVRVNADTSVSVIDQSTNGTAYDTGVMKREDLVDIPVGTARVFDFGGGVTVAVCFDGDQERAFSLTQGALNTFHKGPGTRTDDLLPPPPGTRDGTEDDAFGYRGVPEADGREALGLVGRIIAMFQHGGLSGKLVVLLMAVMIVGIVSLIFYLLGPLI